MATIGTFKKTGNEYVGEIVTLNVQAQNVRIVPGDSNAHYTGSKIQCHDTLLGRCPKASQCVVQCKTIILDRFKFCEHGFRPLAAACWQ